MKIVFFLIILVSHSTFGESLLNFQDVRIGENRVKLSLDDFSIEKKSDMPGLQTFFSQNSIQWVRDNSNLLTPRARLILYLPFQNESTTVHHRGRTYIPQIKKEGSATDLWINLFNPQKIVIRRDKEEVATIQINARKKNRQENTKLIDYSCDPYHLTFKGLESEYMSVGCRLEKVGKWNDQRPRLTVTWTTTDYELANETPPPYQVIFHSKGDATISLVHKKTKERKLVTISAHLPEKLHRLKTALGFGPYMYKTFGNGSESENVIPAAMLYGRFDLIQSASLRFFDAAFFDKSFFNNGGLYFAYELASILDGRISIVPLLGAQVLTYRYDEHSAKKKKAIYPQGFEATWRHSFGFKNLTTVYGMFLSGSGKDPYKNLWVRTGIKYFWELNYIEWRNGDDRVKTFGLSVGVPFLGFF